MKASTVLRYLVVLLILLFTAYAWLAQLSFYGNWLLRYPLFLLLGLAILSAVYGQFGRGFGLSHLFWHERPLPQFWAGASLALLFALQWCLAYELLRDFNGDEVFKDMQEFRTAALWFPETALGYSADESWPVDLREPLGIGPSRDVPPKAAVLTEQDAEKLWKVADRSWSFALLRRVFGPASFPEDVGKSNRNSAAWQLLGAWGVSQRFSIFMLMTLGPCLLLLALPAILPRSAKDWAARRSKQPVDLGAKSGKLFVAGLAFISGLIWIVTPFVSFAYVKIISDSNFGGMIRRVIDKIEPLLKSEGTVGVENKELFLEIAIGQGGLLIALLLTVAMLRTKPLFRRVSPAACLCLILGIFSLCFAWFVNLSFWLPRTMLVLSGLVLLGILALNGGRYRLRFPGLGDYYQRERRVPLAEATVSKPDANAACRLLPSEIALEYWKAACKDRLGAENPKLAMVCVSGGSIRSAFWTAKVLTKLEEEIDGFPYHMRLLTGASGGMLGAAHYVSGITRPTRQGGQGGWSRSPKALERFYKYLPTDSLSPVARRLALFDLPGLISARHQKTDRGHALEEAWIAWTGNLLSRPFRDLAEGEWEGWRPSMVFSPMLVEDGRRLLISNLDLDFLTMNIGSFLDLPELDCRMLPKDDPRFEHQDIYSISAYQFFRLFPEAKDFQVSTAVRMSSTFPFISPAVSLPTNPPRRVVDAGYYDNFGINAAASWAFEHRLWLRKHTSGVVLIQIRAFDSPREIEGPDDSGFALRNGLQFLSSPLEGVLQARNSVMSFRNDEQIEVLSEWFRTNTGRPEFFQTVVFECPASASLSWHITDEERNDILSCLDPICQINGNGEMGDCTKSIKNRRRLECLKQWWEVPVKPTRQDSLVSFAGT